MNFGEKLDAGKFVVTVEIAPPKTADGEDIIKKIKSLKGYADAYNVADNQTAMVRLSSLAGSVFLIREGMEPIMQITCRDRNRIAIQSDVLGAHALGIRNILCITGDHQKFGNQPDSKNVFDIDSTQEIMILDKMTKEGKLWSGDKLLTKPSLYIGATANPFSNPRELHLLRLKNKCVAGAKFIQTQSVFDVDGFEDWMKDVKKEKTLGDTKLIVGVFPLKSLKMANFMAKNVPGTVLPQEILDRMSKAGDEEKEGLKIAVETVEKIRKIKGVSGIHLMPVDWPYSVKYITEESGLRL